LILIKPKRGFIPRLLQMITAILMRQIKIISLYMPAKPQPRVPARGRAKEREMEKELRDYVVKSGAFLASSAVKNAGYIALHFGGLSRLAYASLKVVDFETGHLRPEPEQLRALRPEPGIYAVKLSGDARTARFLTVEVFTPEKAGELRRKLEDKIRKECSALADALN
jgi:hypothetical protein